MITFKEFIQLTEATNLGSKELDKYGDQRPNILIDLIKKKTPLELTDGNVAVVTDIDAAIAAVEQFKKDKQNFNLHTDRGLIANTKLKKSKAFGGGGAGAGGGTAQTEVVESAQCLWCVALLDLGASTPFEKVTEADLRKAFSKVHVTAKLDDMLNITDEWKMSSYLSAKILIEQGYIHRGMEFYRGKGLMTQIYAAKNKAYKNIDISPMKDDKWNPGDIWAADPRFNASELDDTSPRALQKSILGAFVDRRLVGISLKLVKKTAKIKEYNIVLPPDVDDHKITAFGARSLRSGKGDFWSTKGGEIMFDGSQLMQIRDNTRFGTIKVEITGKSARGGGAGWAYIATVIQQIFKQRSPGIREIETAAKAAKAGDKRALNTIYETINRVERMTYNQFIEGLSDKDAGWLHAKYGTCLVLQHVASNGGPKANRFITKLVNYAASQTEDSSAFIKVH
jgi:hypothetical protein